MLLRELPYRSFSESSIPLHLVCTDLITGEEVVISAGEVIEAVIASTAIPGVFPSVLYHGRHLVDGAVSASTPISVAVRLRGDTGDRLTVWICLRDEYHSEASMGAPCTRSR
jgi:NTE family protein